MGFFPNFHESLEMGIFCPMLRGPRLRTTGLDVILWNITRFPADK